MFIIFIVLVALSFAGFILYSQYARISVTRVNMQFSAQLDEKWTSQSSSILVHISSTDNNKKVSMYKALRAQSKAEAIAAGEVSVPEGRYSVEYISPVNADGSMYKVPKTATVDVSAAGASFVDTAEIGENSSEVQFEFIPASKVSS